MKEGYWINYVTGKIFEVDEHGRWIRRPQNAKKIGVPEQLYDEFDEFEEREEREKFLLYLMEKAPLMRVRGHGILYSFEFYTRRIKKPLEMIWKFCKRNAGPYTNMYIVNFATKEKVDILYKDFDKLMKEGRDDDIMRYASKFNFKKAFQSSIKEYLGIKS